VKCGEERRGEREKGRKGEEEKGRRGELVFGNVYFSVKTKSLRYRN